MGYIALRRMRFGEEHLAPGDEVPVEPGRNYNLMLRQGLIADVDLKAQTESEWQTQAAAFKERIAALERELAAANGEGSSSKERALGRMTKAELLAAAEAAGIEADPAASKAQLVELLKT